MANYSPLIDQLARQRFAELQDAADRERVAGRPERLPRTRARVSRTLIALGTRLAVGEPRATNRVTKLAGR